LTLSAQIIGWCVPINSNSSWFSWNILIAYSNGKLKSNSGDTSPSLSPFWIGNTSLHGCEWLASRPGRFTPRERTPGTHWIRGWVGLRAGVDAEVKRKIPSPYRHSGPRGTHWAGGWVDPRTGLGMVVKRKIPSPYRDSKHRSSSP
jgi:hypothetical protein